jgi:hypothetical protein
VSAGQPGAAGLAVGVLTPCFWPEVRRGTERFARELADGLIARGHCCGSRGRPTAGCAGASSRTT